MSYKILDGLAISTEIKNELKEKINNYKEKPTLAVILVGEDKASQIYVKNKEKACEYVGIKSEIFLEDENIIQDKLLELIDKLNRRLDVHGILVQLPLPKHIDKDKIINSIDIRKDVDCFHPFNVGLNLVSDNFDKLLLPCTPQGIIVLLKRYNIKIEGMHVVIIGRSNIVGKPMQTLFLHENATTTVCHSKTKNIKEITKTGDIIVVAAGKYNFLTNDMIKKGAVVVDVGIHKINGAIKGDVDFENVLDKVSYITPVPKGVGPMTISMLLNNVTKAFDNLNCKNV